MGQKFASCKWVKRESGTWYATDNSWQLWSMLESSLEASAPLHCTDLPAISLSKQLLLKSPCRFTLQMQRRGKGTFHFMFLPSFTLQGAQHGNLYSLLGRGGGREEGLWPCLPVLIDGFCCSSSHFEKWEQMFLFISVKRKGEKKPKQINSFIRVLN